MYKIGILIGIIAVLYGIDYLVAFLLKKKGKLNPRQYKMMVRYIPFSVLKYTVLVGVAAIIIVPFAFAFFMSFKTGDDVFRPNIFPAKWVFTNFIAIFKDKDINLIGSFFNSMLYAIPPVTVGIFTSTMAAFALSRLHFRGRDKIFGALFATMCIPGVITLVPSYVMFAKLYGWTDSPLPLLIPGMCGNVGVIFFLRQYLLTLPKELDEAAFMDGLNKGGIFFKITIPLAWPAMLAQFLLAFNGAYNDFMGPLMYLGANRDLFTIQLTIYNLFSSNVRQMEKVMAACIVALLPSVVLFFFAQKYFMGSGISVDGLKG